MRRLRAMRRINMTAEPSNEVLPEKLDEQHVLIGTQILNINSITYRRFRCR